MMLGPIERRSEPALIFEGCWQWVARGPSRAMVVIARRILGLWYVVDTQMHARATRRGEFITDDCPLAGGPCEMNGMSVWLLFRGEKLFDAQALDERQPEAFWNELERLATGVKE